MVYVSRYAPLEARFQGYSWELFVAIAKERKAPNERYFLTFSCIFMLRMSSRGGTRQLHGITRTYMLWNDQSA